VHNVAQAHTALQERQTQEQLDQEPAQQMPGVKLKTMHLGDALLESRSLRARRRRRQRARPALLANGAQQARVVSNVMQDITRIKQAPRMHKEEAARCLLKEFRQEQLWGCRQSLQLIIAPLELTPNQELASVILVKQVQNAKATGSRLAARLEVMLQQERRLARPVWQEQIAESLDSPLRSPALLEACVQTQARIRFWLQSVTIQQEELELLPPADYQSAILATPVPKLVLSGLMQPHAKQVLSLATRFRLVGQREMASIRCEPLLQKQLAQEASIACSRSNTGQELARGAHLAQLQDSHLRLRAQHAPVARPATFLVSSLSMETAMRATTAQVELGRQDRMERQMHRIISQRMQQRRQLVDSAPQDTTALEHLQRQLLALLGHTLAHLE